MEDRSSKLYFGLCILVLIWIGVYWAWEPNQKDTPKISISTQPNHDEDPDISTSVSIPDPELSTTHVPEDQDTGVDSPVESEPISRLIPPEFQSHLVVQGEIMQDIAERFYGNTRMWDVIARANPRIDPLKLRAGMTLRIPIDPQNIQGIVESTDGDAHEPVVTSDPVVEYIVQPGDSLSKIAQDFYGSARHASFIFQSNRDTLRSMDSIRVGQSLNLPPLDP